MRFLVMNTITGVAFLTLIMRETSIVNAANSSCPIVDTKEGFKKADCTGTQIKEIPKDLGNIQHLDVSGNPLSDIPATAFTPYPSLTKLHMKGVTKTSGELKIDRNAFLPLAVVEEIDMDGSSFSLDENIVWPQSLKTLNISSCHVSNINVRNLKKLENFNCSSTKLKVFPHFHKSAPLKQIDLQNTDVKYFTFLDLAPFCTLDYLGFIFNDTEIVNNSTLRCFCSKLYNWLTQYEIKYNEFGCGSSEIECKEVEGTDIAERDRRLCILRNYDVEHIVERLEIVIVAAVLVLVLLSLAVFKAKPVELPKLADTHPFEQPSTVTPAGTLTTTIENKSSEKSSPPS